MHSVVSPHHMVSILSLLLSLSILCIIMLAYLSFQDTFVAFFFHACQAIHTFLQFFALLCDHIAAEDNHSSTRAAALTFFKYTLEMMEISM